MTSLKVKYADEIMDAMAKALDSSEFKEIYRTASLQKEAGMALETFKKEIDIAVAKGTNLELVYSKNVEALAQEDNKEPGTVKKARKYMDKKARGKQPGMVMPEATECADCADAKTSVAMEFALRHLVKVADTLDRNGFVELAFLVDETIDKIAFKKITKIAADWTLLPDGKWQAPSGEVMTEDKAKAMAKALGVSLPGAKPAPGSAGSVAPYESMPQSMDPAALAKSKEDEAYRRMREYTGEGTSPAQLHRAPGAAKKPADSSMLSLQKHLKSWTQMPVSNPEGRYKGEPDGHWGPKTAEAWKAAYENMKGQGYEIDPSIPAVPDVRIAPSSKVVNLFNNLLMRYTTLKSPAKSSQQETGTMAPAPDLTKYVTGPAEVKIGPAARERIPR